MTRQDQRKLDLQNPVAQEASEANCKVVSRNIEKIYFGSYEVETWYHSPFPEEYGNCRELYFCEFCLKYMRKRKTILDHMVRHFVLSMRLSHCNSQAKCGKRMPPGLPVYFDKNVHELNDPDSNDDRTRIMSVSVFEVDSTENKLYCQNLCLIAKLFLDHKTLYYDVTPFRFYVLTEDNDYGCHIVGYFSQEKTMCNDFNLACITVFPRSDDESGRQLVP